MSKVFTDIVEPRLSKPLKATREARFEAVKGPRGKTAYKNAATNELLSSSSNSGSTRRKETNLRSFAEDKADILVIKFDITMRTDHVYYNSHTTSKLLQRPQPFPRAQKMLLFNKNKTWFIAKIN